MEIVEKMSNTQYEAVCHAGVDLVNELSSILTRHGLSQENGFSVLVVAAAGISMASGLSSSHLAIGVDSVTHMWHVEKDKGMIVFDPNSRLNLDDTKYLVN